MPDAPAPSAAATPGTSRSVTPFSSATGTPVSSSPNSPKVPSSDLPLQVASAISSGVKRKHGGGSGSRERHKLVRKERQHARTETSEQRQFRLIARAYRNGDFFLNRTYDIVTDGVPTSTGWQGKMPPITARKLISARYKSGQIIDDLRGFLRIPYEMGPK